jgi:hypothetical protein
MASNLPRERYGKVPFMSEPTAMPVPIKRQKPSSISPAYTDPSAREVPHAIVIAELSRKAIPEAIARSPRGREEGRGTDRRSVSQVSGGIPREAPRPVINALRPLDISDSRLRHRVGRISKPAGSLMNLELRAFIDRVIVPALRERFLREHSQQPNRSPNAA